MSVIIDTGCANITSLKFALERLGDSPRVSADKEVISSARRLFLPGVGSAEFAVENLNSLGLMPVIKSLAQPLLGICLGMQLLLESSAEGNVECIGAIPVKITALDGGGLRLPHMGWNTVTAPSDHPLFNGIEPGERFYFVHSYAAGLSQWTIAESEYGGKFSAAVARGNFMGVQFHPERSGAKGALVLKNFLEIKS